MALKLLLESLDGLHEVEQAHYKKIDDDKHKHNGKFRLDATPVDDLSVGPVNSLTTGYEKLKTEVSNLEGKLVLFKDIDPDIAQSNADKVKEFAELKPEEMAAAKVEEYRLQADQQIKESDDKYKLQIGELQAKLKVQDEELFSKAIHNAAVTAIQKHHPNNNMTLLLNLVKEQATPKLLKDGSHGFVITDDSGTQRMKDPIAGTFMDLDDVVQEMSEKDIYAGAFAGHDQSGSGAAVGTIMGQGGFAIPKETDWKKADEKDRLAIIERQISEAV